MSDANRDQLEYWNGEAGQRRAASQTAHDAIFAPLTEVLFDCAALAPIRLRFRHLDQRE
ncbi:hypothetical protein [Methylobacterium thuringiense]|uniref:Uncharacterized protein n=1 Tax=Methylobacterium thuringiense TaxID=1003091 RepID=A0ABQ4TSW2_9HYPH|nr:hypothetical protein EKPJFOCH_3228 [Methylobacterium thuringiense]